MKNLILILILVLSLTGCEDRYQDCIDNGGQVVVTDNLSTRQCIIPSADYYTKEEVDQSVEQEIVSYTVTVVEVM